MLLGVVIVLIVRRVLRIKLPRQNRKDVLALLALAEVLFLFLSRLHGQVTSILLGEVK